MLATLSGCGLAEVERARMETGDVARQVSALRGSGASAPGAPQAGPRLSTVRLIERRPYVGLTPIEPDPRADLPARYRRADAVTLPLAGIGAAATLAGRIKAATGLAVRFTGPARQAGNSTDGDPPVNVFGEAVRDGLSPDGGIWTGPLDALLDSWTEPSGYEWRYDADRQAIEIVRRCSAVFQIHALAGRQHYTVSSSTQDSAAGGDGEGSGGGNLTSQTISTETDYDPWPEIEGQLKGLLDPGTRLSVAPSSASVTVSGTPRDIARARAFLGYLNREVLRPVSLATTDKWRRQDGGTGEATEWHRIVVFGAAVAAVEKLVRKGAALLVEGRITSREYQDKKGDNRRVTEIVVAGPQGRVNVLSPRQDDGRAEDVEGMGDAAETGDPDGTSDAPAPDCPSGVGRQ